MSILVICILAVCVFGAVIAIFNIRTHQYTYAVVLGVLVCGAAGCVLGVNYLLSQSPQLRDLLGVDQTLTLPTSLPWQGGQLNVVPAGTDERTRLLLWITFSILTFVPIILNAVRSGRQHVLEFCAALAYAACCIALASTYVLQNDGISWAQQLSAASSQALWILAAIWLIVMLLFMRSRARRLRVVESKRGHDDAWSSL